MAAGSTLIPDRPGQSSQEGLEGFSPEQLRKFEAMQQQRAVGQYEPSFSPEEMAHLEDVNQRFNPPAKSTYSPDDGPNVGHNPAEFTPTDKPAAQDKASVPDQDKSTPASSPKDADYNDDGSFKRKPGESNRQYAMRWVGKHKKGLGIGSAIAAGSAGAILFGFLTLAPLKIEFLINNLENKFGAGASSALNNMTDKLMDKYLTKYVLPGIEAGRCTDTLSPNCVANISGKNPVEQLYQTWHQNKMETNLAKDHNIVIGKKNGKLYMSVGGDEILGDAELKAAMSDESLFDEINLVGKGGAASNKILGQLDTAFEDEALPVRMYHRFIYGKFVQYKYGVKRCIVLCELGEKIDATIAEQKQVGQSAFIDVVVRPFSDREADILLCAMNTGTEDACKDALQKIQPTDDETQAAEVASRTTKDTGFQADVATKLAAKYADDPTTLAEIVAQAGEDTGKGITDILVEDVATKLFGDAIGKVAGDVVPYVGWIQLAGQILDIANEVGPAIQHMTYIADTVAAAQTFMLIATAASEFKTGNSTPAILGSFGDLLTGKVDATDTPLYSSYFSEGAPTYDAATTKYRCNDGSRVPTGKLVCPEEDFTRGNDVASTIHNALNVVPGIAGLANIINNNPINWLIGQGLGKYLELQCTVQDALPPQGSCTNAKKQASQYVSNFASWLLQLIVPSPFSDSMNGGRMFDMSAAGADVTENKSCQTQLGCAKLTNQQVADIRNQQAAQEKATFDSQPLFARIFSTDTPYSLMGHLAMSMPANFGDFTTNVASAISNPFSTIGSMFAGILGGHTAFAAAAAQPDPFGIIQYGYTSQQIPDDPETYWNKNCQGDFSANWENSQNQDDVTGEAVATTPEPCLLIQSTVQATGGLANPALLPQDSLNPLTAPGTAATLSSTSANTFWLPSGGGAQFAGLGDNQYDSTSKVSLPWISGQCSQASLAEVLNAYHQGANAAVKNSGAAPPTKSGYYRIIDVERQSYALGVWPGYFQGTPSFKASWDTIASHFNMNDSYSTPAATDAALGNLINEANAGKPVITTAPNHWLVIIGGDSKYVDLLDSSPWNDTWAEAVSNDGSETITRTPVHDAGIKQYGTPTRVLRSTFLHGLSQYADYWGGDQNGDAGSAAPIAVVLTPKN